MQRKKGKERRYPIPLKIKTYLSRVTQNTNLEDIDELDPEISAMWNMLSAGPTELNYATFFHYLLWFEESQKLLSQKLPKVQIYKGDEDYILVVPEDKQESLRLRAGDMVKLKNHKTDEQYFIARIRGIKDDYITIKISRSQEHDLENTRYVDVKFMFPNKLFEMLHDAVMKAHTLNQSYIFPTESYDDVIRTPVKQYFNARIGNNIEQRTAVECIVSGTSGNAPFLVLGPPGTGKTVTIVEAVLQLVAANGTNRILVCAHSNKAVDNVACVLQRYKEYFDEEPCKLLLRINSKGRKTCVPECLKDDSVCGPVSMSKMMGYRIILSTLCSLSNYNLNFISHVVIDEAAQANEPSCLIPASRMSGSKPLILAGDDKQLGPVVVSGESKKYGLGLSLMERLRDNCPLYQNNNDGKHIVMLKNNYRSDANIIFLPNHLFYRGHLRAMAALDPLSDTNILNRRKNCNAIVFHRVFSTEIKVGPSYCNNDELDIIKLYVVRLIHIHEVKEEDIGIIATYRSQVKIIKEWIGEKKYKIDVETVDAFQGQEKRVILISTVRRKGLAVDASLGFVTDEKRFNVALTRAKAKAIVIGNPLSLRKSSVWESYIKCCKKLDTCYGHSALTHNVSSVKNQVVNIVIRFPTVLDIN